MKDDYEKFMKSVKVKKSKAEPKYDYFGQPVLPESKKSKAKPLDWRQAGDEMKGLAKKLGSIKDPIQQMAAFNMFYKPAYNAMQQTIREEASGEDSETSAEYDARMERMIAAYVQSGLSLETARRLAMERMQA